VFDSSIHKDAYGKTSTNLEEETFYVAYSGAKPTERDMEKLLTRAISDPNVLTPVVTTAPTLLREKKPRRISMYEPWGTGNDAQSGASVTAIASSVVTRTEDFAEVNSEEQGLI